MDDDGGSAGRKGSSPPRRKAEKSAGSRDARPASSEGGRGGERVRRQVRLDAETALRFDTHCRSAMPQLDACEELNRILLAYLRQHGRKRKYLDADFGGKPCPENGRAGSDGSETSNGSAREDRQTDPAD